MNFSSILRSGWLAAIGILGTALGCARTEAPPPLPPQLQVRVVPVTRGLVEPVVPLVGTVLPVDVSRVAAGAAGKVVAYPFREGAFVAQDEVLAQLRDITLQIQIEGARQLLREKQELLTQFKAGYRQEEIAQAEAKMRAADATLQFSESNLRRTQELYNRPNRTVSEQELEKAQYERDRAAQDLASAEADFQLKKAGYRSEEIAAQQAAVAAAEQVVAELNDELEKRTIRAPFSGYLVKKQAEVGEWIDMGGEVATLARLDEVEIRVNVEEAFVHEIRPDQAVEVAIDALPGETFQGTVRNLVPRAEWQSGSRSFPVIVRVTNPLRDGRPQLQEGMVARITFRGAAREALLAHKDAIIRTPEKSTVYVVGPDSTARPVEVVEGLSRGEFIEVRGALTEGDLLATEGAERLKPYVQVAVIDPPPTSSDSPASQASRQEAPAQPSGGD